MNQSNFERDKNSGAIIIKKGDGGYIQAKKLREINKIKEDRINNLETSVYELEKRIKMLEEIIYGNSNR